MAKKTSCAECDGWGEVEVDYCTCYGGEYMGIHERFCGAYPCPAGCEYVLPRDREGTWSYGKAGITFD